MAEALNLTLDLAEKVAVIFESSRWKRAAFVALVVSFSLGSAWLLAVSVIFFPVTLVIVAMLLLLAPPLAAVLWVLACTTPACEKIWRPLLVWTGVRGGFVRRFLLMPVEDLMDASEDKGFMREEAISRVDPGDEGQGLVRRITRSHCINHALVHRFRSSCLQYQPCFSAPLSVDLFAVSTMLSSTALSRVCYVLLIDPKFSSPHKR